MGNKVSDHALMSLIESLEDNILEYLRLTHNSDHENIMILRKFLKKNGMKCIDEIAGNTIYKL